MRLEFHHPRLSGILLIFPHLLMLGHVVDSCFFKKCKGMPKWEGKRGSESNIQPFQDLIHEQDFPLSLKEELTQCLSTISHRALRNGICCGYDGRGYLTCQEKLDSVESSYLCLAIKRKLTLYLQDFIEQSKDAIVPENCCLGIEFCSRNHICKAHLTCTTPSMDEESDRDYPNGGDREPQRAFSIFRK